MSAVACESRIVRVEVFARGARVTRRVAAPAGLPGEPVTGSPEAELGRNKLLPSASSPAGLSKRASWSAPI